MLETTSTTGSFGSKFEATTEDILEHRLTKPDILRQNMIFFQQRFLKHPGVNVSSRTQAEDALDGANETPLKMTPGYFLDTGEQP